VGSLILRAGPPSSRPRCLSGEMQRSYHVQIRGRDGGRDGAREARRGRVGSGGPSQLGRGEQPAPIWPRRLGQAGQAVVQSMPRECCVTAVMSPRLTRSDVLCRDSIRWFTDRAPTASCIQVNGTPARGEQPGEQAHVWCRGDGDVWAIRLLHGNMWPALNNNLVKVAQLALSGLHAATLCM
jgi:hypothetical protein